MNIVFLTADEPIYLPAVFAELLKHRAGDTKAVFTVPSRYGHDSTLRMATRYTAAFGVWNLFRLAQRTLKAKLYDALGVARKNGRFHSVAACAAEYKVRTERLRNVNDKAFLDRLREMNTDLIVSVSCPQIFRKDLINLPPLGCLNMHGALLPKYRGIAPSFWMMAHGERRAGVTVFFVNEDIDAGEVVTREEYEIFPEETLDQFIIRSKRIACGTLLRAIDMIEKGRPPTKQLDMSKGSYFGFPTREAYRKFRHRGRRLW
ncbi:MAG: formyltransferase family protein [Planctomycetota bacterium]|nr:formyltransferase family protein [Planctomycetota bacterium]